MPTSEPGFTSWSWCLQDSVQWPEGEGCQELLSTFQSHVDPHLIIPSSDKKRQRRISKLPRLKCVCQQRQIFILNRNTIPAKYSESEELVASLEMADIISERLCGLRQLDCASVIQGLPLLNQTQYPVTPWSQYYPTNALLSSDQNQISSHHIKTLNWVETLDMAAVTTSFRRHYIKSTINKYIFGEKGQMTFKCYRLDCKKLTTNGNVSKVFPDIF